MVSGIHWIGAEKIKILPQPEIEFQPSSTSFADGTITEKYVFTFSELFKNEQVRMDQLVK
jgi:hypothetical protein